MFGARPPAVDSAGGSSFWNRFALGSAGARDHRADRDVVACPSATVVLAGRRASIAHARPVGRSGGLPTTACGMSH